LNELIEKIVGEIRNRGAISFARFMDCALYCPVYGYYEKEEDTLGRGGDYYTSAGVGPLFGELLALQFADWLTSLRAPPDEPPLQIVEAGVHQGQLARDILTWFRANRPKLCQSIQYWIVEPSSRRQDWQRRTLAQFHPQVRWVKSLAELGETARPGGDPDSPSLRGILFSNELLDALPVHRFGWDAARSVWFEWGVTLSNGVFVWTRLTEQQSEIAPPEILSDGTLQLRDLSSVPLTASSTDLRKALPDGFAIDLCPAASQWWRQAARILDYGKVVAIDYGLTSDELFSPERTGGTLRAYHRHHLSPNVLENPGEQDLTAHVNFSALRQAGEAVGLKTEVFLTQEQFLTRIAASVFNGQTAFGQWTPERTRQFQTLTHPNHLGRSFRVLVQSCHTDRQKSVPGSESRP
jgi:SAM-dependent MidA family methyltransferase